ncbi:helicase-related protein [Paenibacillus sp. RS8]|uniref:helicase-related protein n=1 Tax=Paenibacillus sp. RS8 TaxID=3242681 RepID=UPI0035BF167E
MGCAYCEACLALGRSRACALLLRSAALPAVRSTAVLDPTAAAGRWGLSPAQAGAAGAALGFLAERRERSAKACPERFLLWAVTGAGKTEMIFPLLEAVLAAGGRALVATPRRDVVLELAPRLAKAFPAETLAVLYGGSAERWVGGRLTLATTHQLLRFHRSFDLVIIDELDAYPYHNDPMLAYAAEQACKANGSFIYLSATPPQEMQRLVRSGRLPHARVPVRFHGHPLPVPQHLTMTSVQTCLKRGMVPRSLIHTLRKSLEREAQIFCFVSRIAHIEGLLDLLRRSFPGVVIEGTSSKDPFRTEKVTAFRSRAISLLVTTTILERGVTVPRSDVFILDADSDLFDEASLVQMAGRAGRSKDDPAGRVVFASPQWTRSQRGAISQIRTMNIIARRKGYISKDVSR